MLLKSLGLVILAAVMASPAWPQAEPNLISDPDVILEDPVNRALSQQHYHDMWLFLGESKITWIRTAAALHFIGNFVRESDPELRARGERLLTAIISAEPRDTHTLWLLLDACHEIPDIPGCASTRIGDRLIESAPDNAAVYLKAAGVGVGSAPEVNVENDKKSRHTLLKASRAPEVDIYHGRDALELYSDLKAFEESYEPTHEPAIDLPVHIRAVAGIWLVFAMRPPMTFAGLFDLCEAQVREGRTEYVDACLTLSRTMRDTGKSLITQVMGYALERRMMETMGEDEATVLYLYRKGRMLHKVIGCQRPWAKVGKPWPEFDESSALDFWSDFETLGEVAAIRNQAIRDYQTNPEDYEQDPAVCDQLMDLDSESMGIFLGKLDPKRLMESNAEESLR